MALFYGLEGNTPAIFEAYRKPGHKALYVDLGYWGRREGGRFTGYHKIVVNARHPNKYLMATAQPPDRLARFNVSPAPWHTRQIGHILLAGMGDKGAQAEGFAPEQWERWAIRQLRQHTDRQIIYRPKPSWKTALPIEGVGFSHRLTPVQSVYEGCWAVVTHHSNVAMEAELLGIPAFCWSGVGALMASQDLSRIEDPARPHGREQWAANIAYTQWSVVEMASGAPWIHLMREGLLR